MIEENKYFIFDRPKQRIKYVVNNLLYPICSMYYRCKLYLNRPKVVNKKKYYTSICAIFKNEAKYFREWIEFHKIIGVDHFYLYNNFSNDNYKEALESYINCGDVTLIEWPVKQGQMKAYSDCVEKFSEETNWIAFIDLDEYIVPNHTNNIKDSLRCFDKDRPIIIAYWRLFGTSGRIDRDEKGLITEDFINCWRKYTNIGKVFYNTAYDYADELKENENMHIRWGRFNKRKLPPINFCGKIICRGIDKITSNYPPVQINHYFTKSYKEYLEKMSRGDAYFELNPRDEKYFEWHDMKCQSADYNIKKYMINLKKAMNKGTQ